MTDRKKQVADLRGIVEDFAERALGAIGVAVICADSDGIITFINIQAETMTGWSARQALGMRLGEVFRLETKRYRRADSRGAGRPSRPHTSSSGPSRDLHDSRQSVPGGGQNGLTDEDSSYMFHRSGNRVHIKHGRMYLWNDGGGSEGQVVVFANAQSTSTVVQPAPWESGRDHVTGLLNRQAFTAHLNRELKKYKKTNKHSALCYIDLDQFRLINDTCGHDVGDALLQWVSALLREATSEKDILARLSGDEFGVLLRDCSEEDAKEAAKNIRSKLRRFSFNWEDHLFTVGLRIGVVPLSEEIGTVEDLLFAADHASFQAGEMGGEKIYVYKSEDAAIKQRQKDMDCAAAIKRNLSVGRFQLFGQVIRPLNYSHTDKLHFEVLLRPMAEDGSLGSPVDVIRAAEQFGGMELLDRWVIRNTLQVLKNKSSMLADRLDMCSINLSGSSFRTDGMLEYIHEQIAESKVPPAKVCFEITETAAVRDFGKARWLIEGVSAIGCRFALDDFGSGMASYGYLKDLPVDYLKIDGAFIKDLTSNSLNHTIVGSINQIGHFLGIRTIAEFVGSRNIFDELIEIGVDYAQGYWTGKPMPLSELFKPDSIPPLFA